jgi:hypothetical protein
MTDPQALELARKIVSRWRFQAPLEDWVAELARLDHDVATTAYGKLRGLLEDPGPSIPRFKSECRAIAQASTQHPHEWPTLDEPRLTRDERMSILLANGAPERLTGKRKERL